MVWVPSRHLYSSLRAVKVSMIFNGIYFWAFSILFFLILNLKYWNHTFSIQIFQKITIILHLLIISRIHNYEHFHHTWKTGILYHVLSVCVYHFVCLILPYYICHLEILHLFDSLCYSQASLSSKLYRALNTIQTRVCCWTSFDDLHVSLVFSCCWPAVLSVYTPHIVIFISVFGTRRITEGLIT